MSRSALRVSTSQLSVAALAIRTDCVSCVEKNSRSLRICPIVLWQKPVTSRKRLDFPDRSLAAFDQFFWRANWHPDASVGTTIH